MVESDGDGAVKTIKVGVIAHHHPGITASLVVSALKAMENVEVVELGEKDILSTEDGIQTSIKDLMDKFPESSLHCGLELISPYAGMGRRGKGEKKRERAHLRRFYGRRNSF